MARVFLSNETYNAATSGATINGTAGSEQVNVLAGTTGLTITSSVERVDLSGNIADYTFSSFGAGMTIRDSAGNIVGTVSESGGKSFVFADGALSAAYAGTTLSLGGVALTGTAAAISPTAADIDATTTSDAAGSTTGGTTGVAGETFTLTISADTVIGVGSGDVINGTSSTIGASDIVIDATQGDGDQMTLLATGATLASMGTVVNIEEIDLSVDVMGANFTVTTAGGVSNGALTVNSVRAGGVDTVIIGDIGSDTTVTAGTRVDVLTVDYGAARSNVTVVGGEGATVVNGSAQVLSTATVDASAGTSVDVEFGAESSNITVTAGSGAVDINDGGGVETTGFTLNAASATTVTADFADDSSNISLTTGTGAVVINDGAAATVTGLVIDATAAEGTIAVSVEDGSDVTITAGSDAGAITVDSTSVAATTDDGSSITITADAADIAGGVTDFDTVTMTLNGSTSSVALDDSVVDVTLSATDAAQTVTAITGAVNGTVTLNGSNAITFEMSGADVDELTVVTDGAADHVLKLSTAAQTADTDLTGVSSDVLIELGFAMAASGTGEFTLADGASVKASVIQNAALGFTAASAESEATLDLTGVVHTGSFAFTNMSNVTVTASTASTTAATITVDSDTSGTQGNITLTGSNALALASTTDAELVDGSALTGALTATMSATLDNLVSGSGDDEITAYDGDFTVNAGSGDNTLVVGAIDLSDNTVSVTGIDVVSLGTADATILNGQFVGTETITGTTGTLTVIGTSLANTIDVSGFTNSLTQSVDGDGVIVVNGLGGADVITGGDKNENLNGGSGDDTITGGGGQDVIVGAAGADTIDLTETTSVGDWVVYNALTEGSAAGTDAGTFSGYDNITGFIEGTDIIRFDSALTGGDTTAAVTAIIDDAEVAASTAASTALTDLNWSEAFDVDQVLAYINDGSVMGTAFTYTGGQDELLGVTFADENKTVIYQVTSADTAISATEVALIAVVDDVITAGSLDIA